MDWLRRPRLGFLLTVATVVCLLAIPPGLGELGLTSAGQARANQHPSPATWAEASARAGLSSVPRSEASPSAASWTNLTSSSSPSGRYAPNLVYDAKDGFVVLFGGWTNIGGWRNETWKFVGGTWTNITPPGSPYAADSAMAYDALDGYVVLFGGKSCTPNCRASNDTWEFTAGRWTNITSEGSPPPRVDSSMVYDPMARSVILFGGHHSAYQYNDTWKFASGHWTKLKHTRAPLMWGSGYNPLAYDSKDGNIVIQLLDRNNTLSTWKFAKGAWSVVSTNKEPPAQYGFSLAYDRRLACVVLFGGFLYNLHTYTYLNQTWEYSNGSWRIVPISLAHPPGARDYAGTTYDPKDGYLLLFGGMNFTTALLSDSWKFG